MQFDDRIRQIRHDVHVIKRFEIIQAVHAMFGHQMRQDNLYLIGDEARFVTLQIGAFILAADKSSPYRFQRTPDGPEATKVCWKGTASPDAVAAGSPLTVPPLARATLSKVGVG